MNCTFPCFYLQMVSEFESVNASFKIADNSTLPSYEEANETLSSQSVDVITNVMEYFLGEVLFLMLLHIKIS